MQWKDILCKCKWKFDGINVIQIKYGKSDKSWCQHKKHNIYEKDYIWNSAACSCENRKHLVSIIYNSAITCDEIIKETKTVSTNFNEKKYNL